MKINTKYRPLFWLIIISTLARIFIASFVELGNDEVYYYTYALFPAWSHFDHPPMVGWFIQLFSANFFMHSQLLLRLSSIVLAAVNTWLMFELGRKINNERTGLYAAALYTASIYTSLIVGVFIMPDTPQIFFWILSLYLMLDILPDKETSQSSKRNFLLLGVLIGFGMLSKYTSVFLWSGVFLYLLFYNRNWLKSVSLYISGLISLLIFSPVLWWNNKNHFISFTFHEDRVSLLDSPIRFDFVGTEMLGEFLYQNPVVFILVWIAVVFGIKHRNYFMEWQKFQILLLQALPMIAVFLFVSLFRKTLPHWTGPAYISLILIAAAYLSDRYKDDMRIFPKSISLALISIFLLISIGFAQVNYGIINLKKWAGSDLTLDMYGWRKLAAPFAKVKQEAEAKAEITKNAPIISYRWFPAAHIDYYVALPNQTSVLGLGSLERIHKYAWINRERGGFYKGMDAWYLAFDYDYKSPDFLKPFFNNIIPKDTIEIQRGGETAKLVYVYLLKDLKKLPKSDFEAFLKKSKNP